MRIAVISDIHGNCFGLDAALADLEKHPPTNRLPGDAIQGGPQPAQTVARLRELACPIVMGNADAWLLTGEETSDNEQVTKRMAQARQWQLSQLSAEDKEFIKGFQSTIEIPLEGDRNLLCFHGSPNSFDDLIFSESPEEDFLRLLGPFQPTIMTGGHTHIQFVRRLGDTFFFNPGSVGLAYNRHQPEESFKADAWAEYAVITSEPDRLALEFRRVPYDPREMVRIILESRIPYAEVSGFAVWAVKIVTAEAQRSYYGISAPLQWLMVCLS